MLDLFKSHANPKDALRELLVYFEYQKIILPTYRSLQDLFTNCIDIEDNRLQSLILNIPNNISTELSKIIKSKVVTDLTQIKADQKGFKLSFITDAISVVSSTKDIYFFCKEFLPSLKITNNCISYYASFVKHYSPSRVRMLKESLQWLYLLCFIYIKYQQCIDNLIISFTYHYRNINKLSTEYVGSEEIKYNAKIQESYPKISEILRLIPSDSIDHKQPYSKFLDAVYKLLPEEEYSIMADAIDGKVFNKEESKWKFIDTKSRFIACYLRPLILNVDFDHSWKKSRVVELINILKNHYKISKSHSKLKIKDDLGITVPSSIIDNLKLDGEQYLDPTRFEFYVYRCIYNAFDSGTLFCPDSCSYKDLKDDLVSDKVVDNVEEITKQYGYDKIPIYCDEHLDYILNLNHEAWIRTNSNIDDGTNTGIHIEDGDSKENWTLSYEANESEYKEKFFNSVDKIDITDLLLFISDKAKLWSKFTHIKPRFSKQYPDKKPLLACILADAFGFGIKKMAEICNLNINTLTSTQTNFIRQSTLKAANDAVADLILSLPIFKIWNIEEDKTLSDIDGSKYMVRRKTIQARHSKKYFGKSQGISIMKLVANHVALNSRVIGCNEHESYFAFDLIYHNNTDLKIDMLTGDNHSINQMNFIALDAIDTEFVPSFRNIKDQAYNLYCAKSSDQYKGFLKPKSQVDIPLIKSQKKEITRVLLSLILQHNTQATIVRKLSSHRRNLVLKKALWEYNKIFRSTHILNLINDEQLRKKIKRARNRTEAYHQLHRTIRKVHRGVFPGKSIIEDELCNQASRLVANCTIAYNAILLSNVYEKLVIKYGEDKAKEIMHRISPVAWQHINFIGRYKFLSKGEMVDFESLVRSLIDQLENHLSK